ncbi:hypothetical protein SAMN02746041_00339 [Desulfacinum hydrothermale DSM 13146]|uniref:Uncharacterized protein n=1 Tax=Desulfacinum hydrothermale DSM 13146 TaxID=1121390 RepID=A0A1W1X0V6_9BACT|nr:hypothetical protein [Desulfacinum hydrothermale]SMC17544.1 hypothetical protein SAMN02746041_00339 [Desulfacinum hydrothermale DSM 13146]
MKRVVSVLILLLAAMGAACAARAVTVEHYLTYSNKGSRSEARHGHLKINGKEIPWCFDWLVADGRSFSFHTRMNLWGDDGYFPDASPPPEKVSRTKVPRAALARGYYVGDERLSGTPSSWIFVGWQAQGVQQSAHVDPMKIEVLIEDLHLPVKDGMTRMLLRRVPQ